MKQYRIRVGLDVDDTLYDCNGYALSLLAARHPKEPAPRLEEIGGWGIGRWQKEREALYADPDFVGAQPLLPGAARFVRTLSRMADVFFITAVPAPCMSVRAKRLMEDFPEIPAENIIIGTRKDVITLDILLDDGGHNISSSRAAYPVLMRRPWNTDLSGLLSVNSYDDFLHFCRMVQRSFLSKEPDVRAGGVVCLVGPTGSMKNRIAGALCKLPGFARPLSTTTRPQRAGESPDVYRFLSEEDFLTERDAGHFVETTVYSRYYFGTSREEIEAIVSRGQRAVIPIDICGALTVKNLYRERALLIFLNRPRPKILLDILGRNLPDEDKARRILSLDHEYRNAQLCDTEVSVGDDPATDAAAIARLCRGEKLPE